MTPQIPAARRAAFAAIADATRCGKVLIACRDRVIRRQYLRAVAKRGGVVANLTFYIASDLPDDAVARLRAVGTSMPVYDVRELGTGGQG